MARADLPYTLSGAFARQRQRLAYAIEPTPLVTMPPQPDGVRRIAVYAHHHGSGHWRRAAEIAKVLGDEFQVLVLTSAEIPENAMPKNVTVQPLPLDIVEKHAQPAGSTHHYTPAGP